MIGLGTNHSRFALGNEHGVLGSQSRKTVTVEQVGGGQFVSAGVSTGCGIH